MERTTRPIARLSSRAAPLLLLLVAALALAAASVLHATWIDEPFDASYYGVVAAETFGYTARAFDALGASAVGFQPALFFQETTPASYLPYRHHPPLAAVGYYGAYVAFGRDEAAMRVLSIALLALAHGFFFLLARRAIGVTAGVAATAVFATLPHVLAYGGDAGRYAFALGLGLGAVWAWLKFEERRSWPRYALYAALGILGGTTSWYVYGIVPALGVLVLLDPAASGRRIRLITAVAAPYVLAIGAFVGWIVLVSPAPAQALEDLLWLTQVPVGAELDPTIGARASARYLPAVGRWLVRGAGVPVLVAAAIGAIVLVRDLVRRPIPPAARVAFAVTVAGLLPIVVFWSRVIAHEFMMLSLSPALALLAVYGVAALLPHNRLSDRRAQSAAPYVAALLLALVVAIGVHRGLDLHRGFRSDEGRRLGAALSATFGPSDLLLLHPLDYRPGLRFYTRPPLIPCIDGPDRLDWAFDFVRPGAAKVGAVYVLSSGLTAAEWLWAAELVELEDARIVGTGPHSLVAVPLNRDRLVR